MDILVATNSLDYSKYLKKATCIYNIYITIYKYQDTKYSYH